MSQLFELRGTLPHRTKIIIEIGGICFFMFVWWLITTTGWVTTGILPTPQSVLKSFPSLHFEDAIVRHALFSIKLNLLGYLEAVAIAIPLGFLIGLFPIFRALLERHVTAARYIPLSAVIGLFITWFGLYSMMKVQFLALGIVVYLLPTVVQRIDEVKEVYVQTVTTLGATKWQQIKTVFIPDVISRVSDDIRVLGAISWTYIIIAEVVNKSEGGIGAQIFTVARQSRTDKVFGILLIIILIGFLQDKLFLWIDRRFFKHKYAGEGVK